MLNALVSIHWPKLLLAGFAATLVVTMMMYFGAPMMLGAPMDIAAEISKMLNLPWFAGMTMHFIFGTLIFPIAFAVIQRSLLPGKPAIKGLIFGVVLWLMAMLLMSPMMGKGVFMGGMPAALVSLLGHMAYGLVLGWLGAAAMRSGKI